MGAVKAKPKAKGAEKSAPSFISSVDSYHEIVFDTETTGLTNNNSTDPALQPRIIELAAIKLDMNSGKELDRMAFLAHPGHGLSPEITKITGITDKDLDGQPPFVASLQKLTEFFIGVRRVGGHNVWFDLDLLYYELVRLNAVRKFPWPPIQFDTIDLSMHITGRRMKLVDLHQHLFKKPFDAHRAMNDTEACVRCYIKLKEDA